MNKFKPLLLLIGFPCTNLCIMNENMNYQYRMEELLELRARLRPLLRWVVSKMRQQLREGRLVLLENPLRSRLWTEPAVAQLITEFNLLLVKCDGGYFGATNHRGQKIIKTYQFATNSPEIAQALRHQLTPQERAECTPLEGKAVTQSQEYPMQMVQALLKALRCEAQRWSPHRFDELPKEVYFAQPSDDEPTWRRLLDEVDQIFMRSSTKALTLQPGHDLYDKISTLVPWELGRIQIASKPLTRRQPREVPHTHRGSILLHNDDSISIEVEDMLVNQFPKQRFDKPVRCAIFFYGFAAPDQPCDEPQRQEPPVHLPIPGLSTDITFKGAPATLPISVRSSLARLHIGAGHPHKKELIRLLATHGSINSTVMTALEYMKCGTCERNAKPTQPATQPEAAAVPQFTGQFGERVQADVFYTRDLASGNHPILGVIDMATNLQQAIRLVSLNAQHVWDSFRTIWFQPYGCPLILELDAGTPFAGIFKEHSLAAGIHVVVVPPEAHWRIGAVERRNAVLRTVIERLVDNHGVVDGEGIDFVLIAATQAINSTTATKGRSPYQATFGKLPRFPGDLFGDDHALTVGERYLMAEQLRVQALHAINEMRASQTIRRAILRKTPPNKAEAQQILPGSLAAYWRWSKKASGRKRGGYALGRLVQHDTTNNTAWLQTGGSLVQVTYEQLRPAFGLEGWVPSQDDIKSLKDAKTRLQDGLWLDERGEGPPEDEPLDPSIALAPQTPGGPPDLVPPLADVDMPAPETPGLALRLPLAATDTASAAAGAPQTPAATQPQVFSPTYKQTTTHNIHQHFYDSHHETRERTPRRHDTQPTTSDTIFHRTIQTQQQLQQPIPQAMSLPATPHALQEGQHGHDAIMGDVQQTGTDMAQTAIAADSAQPEAVVTTGSAPAITLQTKHGPPSEDYWQNTASTLIRHHIKPRRHLCTPSEFHTLPTPASKLTGTRTTCPNSDGVDLRPIQDNWINSTQPQQDLGMWWIGSTHFMKYNNPTWITFIAATDNGEPVMFTPPPPDWDGRPITNEHMPVPQPSRIYRTKAAKAENDEEALNSSSDEDVPGSAKRSHGS